MPRRDVIAALIAAMSVVAHAADPAAEPRFRERAPITVEAPGAFVRLPLPVAAHAASLSPALADLRIVDADGARVPFALLPPRGETSLPQAQPRDVKLYPLPPRTAGATTADALGVPLELSIRGDRIELRRGGKPAAAPAAAPGWVIDLGDPKDPARRDEPAPARLELRWSGPAEFSLGYSLQTGDDLRQWRAAGGGQLLALAGGLEQRSVPLPASPGRFVRIVWEPGAIAPVLESAQAVVVRTATQQPDPPLRLALAPSPDPTPPERDAPAGRHVLHFDLGAALPVERLALQWPAGTAVLPATVQLRSSTTAPWQSTAGTVFYRLERDGTVLQPPPLELRATARYVRLAVDARAGAFDAGTVRLAADVRPAELVFVAQGRPPYALLAGAATAANGALPVDTLVPSLADERVRFGRATLGAFSEDAAAVQQAVRAEQKAALRPWLLWAVLLVGVAGLGAMVWRLARPTPAA